MSWCKACCCERSAERASTISVTSKVCSTCHLEKPAHEFDRNRNRPDGLYPTCKECKSGLNHARVQKRWEVMQQQKPETKRCSHCHQEKPASEFYNNANAWDGTRLSQQCKECMRQRSRAGRLPTLRARWYSYSSDSRGVGFSLSRDQFVSFWQKPCHYCGGVITTIGLDRVDNAVGYTMDNVVSCCEVCNVIKNTIPVDAWLAHLRRIVAKADGHTVDPNAPRPSLGFFTWRTKRASA